MKSILNRFAGLGFILLLSQPAMAVSVGIPMLETGVPAVDLVHQGREIDRDEAVDLSTRGVDLSTLSPKESDAWTNASLPLNNAANWNYPADGATLSFDSFMPSTERTARSRVVLGSGVTAKPFQLIVSVRAHQALTLAALLRRMGYPVASPKLYKTLTVTFANKEKRDDFLNNVADRNQACRGRWLKYTPANVQQAQAIAKDPCTKMDYLNLGESTQVTLQDVVLEPAQIDTWMFHWGVIAAQNLKGRRALRALLMPLVLADIPESINLFSFEVGRILTNILILTHPKADQWQETAFSDLKWISRRLSALTRAELQAIVAQGEYPSDVAALIVEKMIGRQKQLSELFGTPAPTPYVFNSNITIGSVRQGKLTQPYYDGYAQHFAYPDPESPLRTDEIGRYFLLNSMSSALGKLVEKVNQALLLSSVSEIATRHQNELRAACQLEFSQTGGCTRPVGYWGGLHAGVNMSAERSVITGNLYGGDAKVQLVDNIGVSASVGMFSTKDGLPSIGVGSLASPIQAAILGNMQVQRNYTHVRPVTSMSAAIRDNWGNLYVPKFMSNLAATLDIEGSEDPTVTRPEEFFADLKEGEMFIITDSLAVGLRAQASLPLNAILDVAVMGASPQLSASIGTQRAIIRRTTITRTSEGIQVYLQRINTGSFDWSLDFNWWINVAKYSQTTRHSKASTKAFLMGTVAEDKRKMAAIALKALLKSNNSEILEGEFGYFALNHEVDARVNQGRFLKWRWYALEESHLVKIKPPRDAEGRINPDEHERSLFSHRFVKTKGSNNSALLSDVINQYAPGWNVLPASGVNPANSFLGEGQWAIWQSEAEVTPGREGRPVTTVEHHWGGWKLPRAGLLQILAGIDAKIAPLNNNRPIMRRDDFQMVRELQFYEIISKLIIYQNGTEKLRRFFFPGRTQGSDEASNKMMHQRLIQLEISGGTMTLNQYRDYCWNEEMPNMAPDFFSMYLPGRGRLAFGESLLTLPKSLWMQTRSNGEPDVTRDPNYYCVKPWMRYFLDNYAKAPTETKARIAWQTRFIKELESRVPFVKVMSLMDPSDYLFQVRISGFSGMDSTLNDEFGFLDYQSDTVGTLNELEGAGIFSEFSNQYGISAHELNARYLGEGF